MVNNICLDHKLYPQCNKIGNGIIPGKCRWQPVKHKQQNEREKIRHILHCRVALLRGHIDIIQGDHKARSYSR